MPSWRTLIDKDFMGSWDLVDPQGKPKDYTLTIESVQAQILKTRDNPKGKRKATIAFVGAKKRMVANSTNCTAIEGMYGDDYTRWVGKMITIYPTETQFGRKTVPCIRVRPTVPKGKSEVVPDREPTQEDEAMRARQVEASGEAREPGGD